MLFDLLFDTNILTCQFICIVGSMPCAPLDS